MPYHVLVVDDDPLQCRSAEILLKETLGYQVSLAAGGREAVDLLLSKQGKSIDLVLLDLAMPDMDGMGVLRAVRPLRPDLPFIINTAYGDVKKAVEALREGAADFIEKQDGPDRIRVSIENVRRLSKLQGEVERLQRSRDGHVHFGDIVSDSQVMRGVKELARKAAISDIPVLIRGASGVGKELFARAIHGESQHSGGPFVAVNCGAIPENLVESILFGHEKGAFTGAAARAQGKFREAEGGTLFLDEVGELPLPAQVKLLRALQQGEIEPVGAARPVKVDVRIVSATNRDIENALDSGEFREDLYYRLNVFSFTVPPLAKRKEDISMLLDYFCERVALAERRPFAPVSQEARGLLSLYDWPGNVRQLENAVYRAFVLSDGAQLEARDFAGVLNDNGKQEAAQATGCALELLGGDGGVRSMPELEAEILRQALVKHDWHISEVARRLNLGRSTLYRKMQEYGIRMGADGRNSKRA